MHVSGFGRFRLAEISTVMQRHRCYVVLTPNASLRDAATNLASEAIAASGRSRVAAHTQYQPH